MPKRAQMTPGFTLGESLANRRLVKSRRHGVEHYEPGQHQARIDKDGDAWLTYVDQIGHLVLAICHKSAGKWVPIGLVRSGTVTSTGMLDPALMQFELSEQMLEALANAEQEA